MNLNDQLDFLGMRINAKVTDLQATLLRDISPLKAQIEAVRLEVLEQLNQENPKGEENA